MVNRRKKFIGKLLILNMCISLVPTTMAFAAEANTGIVNYPRVMESRMLNNTLNSINRSYANVVFSTPSGNPVIGWLNLSNKWYYFGNNGVIKIGWVDQNGKRYYFNSNSDVDYGQMEKGWIQDNGKWYYLDESGIMVTNTNIDGYNLGEDGAMI